MDPQVVLKHQVDHAMLKSKTVPQVPRKRNTPCERNLCPRHLHAFSTAVMHAHIIALLPAAITRFAHVQIHILQ